MRKPLLLVFTLVCLLILGMARGPLSPRSSSAHHTTLHMSSKSAAALSNLLVRSVPGRDLYALAEQLRLRPPRPIPHMVRHSSANYAVGRQDRFYVLAEDQNKYFTLKATILAKTPHLYLYVENGTGVSRAQAQKAANDFEHSIYPTDRSFFGSEWRPGVDDDPHITCLVADLRSTGVGGYYSAEDEYPHLVNPYSNQREMFYVDSKAESPGDPAFDSTLSHEFQHMIHWHVHPHENVWLNEGMSMLAEKLNGYPPTGEPDTFISEPTIQLNTWRASADSSIPHYGAAYLFLSYLYERYGRGIVHDMLSDRQYTDFQLIDDVLRKRQIHTNAESLFAQWVVANQVNGGGIYGYKELTRLVATQKTAGVPFSYKASIPPYAASYVAINVPAHSLRLNFSGAVSVPVVGTQDNGPFWWSNRGDMMDTRLVRSVDLTHVHKATLSFKTWYDIEKNYDYGYVEASTNGKSWDTLHGTHTTRINPYRANYGNGYTGTTKKWRTEKVDLSRYAGHRIKLRFEYITDESYNGQSWAIKDLTIPEIHYRDNFTGWHPSGFVPVLQNALPNKWRVQLIAHNSKGIAVTTLKLKGSKGSVVINPAQTGLKKLVVAVYTSVPKTTVTSAYTLTAMNP
jgi:immune inhibitor A